MKKKGFILKGLVIGVIVYLLAFQPLPYYVERPGNAVEINSKVEVNGETGDSSGQYLLTTVELMQATPLTYFSQFFPHHTGVRENQLLGDFEDYDTYRTLQNFYMDSSIHSAKAAAFNEAELPYDLEYLGVYVMSVSAESDFTDSLEIGDNITEIDGSTFSNTEEFINYIGEQEAGDSVTLTIRRGEDEFQTSGELVELEETGAPGIGISLVNRSAVDTEPEVTIQAGNIGGPSAGLMFSLQIYTMLVEEDIGEDLLVAGTGTISEAGEVGRIGGIDKKIVAADSEGVDVFFAPNIEVDPALLEQFPNYQTNYDLALETAEDIGTDMEIVPVEELSDAITYLLELTEK